MKDRSALTFTQKYSIIHVYVINFVQIKDKPKVHRLNMYSAGINLAL